MTNLMPIWQTRPCAPWCTSVHHDADGIGSRHCLSDPSAIGLKLMETLLTQTHPEAQAALDTLNVGLEQDDRETAPRLTFYRANGVGFDMTLDEAQALADHITRLIAQAGR